MSRGNTKENVVWIPIKDWIWTFENCFIVKIKKISQLDKLLIESEVKHQSFAWNESKTRKLNPQSLHSFLQPMNHQKIQIVNQNERINETK